MLVLISLKIDIERLKDLSYDFEKFEKVIFIKIEYNKVAIKFFSKNCERSIYIGLELRDYRKS
jgi:hypothetical protein